MVGYELVLITHRRRQIGVSFNAGVFTDAVGAALGILAGARDITAQKTLERQLRDQQFYTRSLIESNIDTLVMDTDFGCADSPRTGSRVAGKGFRFYCCVPLIVCGEPRGVLDTSHRAPVVPDNWLNYLEALAGQATIALDNAEVFRRLQQTNADLALVYDATLEGWVCAGHA